MFCLRSFVVFLVPLLVVLAVRVAVTVIMVATIAIMGDVLVSMISAW